MSRTGYGEEVRVCIEYDQPGYTLPRYENPDLTNGTRITRYIPRRLV